MPTLVIKSVPESLHRQLKRIAAAHRRPLTQETMHLLEKAPPVPLGTVRIPPPSSLPTATSDDPPITSPLT